MFNSPIKKKITNKPNLDRIFFSNLKEGYGTIVLGAYPISKYCYKGHFFIIYKHKNDISYYDPRSGKNSYNIKDVICSTFKCWISYHNIKKTNSKLIESKLNIPIKY